MPRAMRGAMPVRVDGRRGTGQSTGRFRPAFVNIGPVVGSANAGRWSVSLNRVGPGCWIDMWKEGLPPLLYGSRDKHHSSDAPQPPKRRRLLQSARPGLRHVQKRRPPFAIQPPDQDAHDVTGEHTVGNQDRGDDEEHPREGHGGEGDSAQESFGHFGVHGGESHACQGHGNQPLGGTLAAVTLQKIQEAVEQASGGRQQEEREQEAHRADPFLQTAAEEHQRGDVQEKLGGGLVVEGVRHQPVEVSVLKHSGPDAEDPQREVVIHLDAEQNARQKNHGQNPARDDGNRVFEHLKDHFKVICSRHLAKQLRTPDAE